MTNFHKLPDEIELEEHLKPTATNFFRDLRDRICAEFEAIEGELGEGEFAHQPPLAGMSGPPSKGHFSRKIWYHKNDDGAPGGGGEISLMKGRVFEKVGVNISNVYGRFSENFRQQIPGAEENGGAFWAAGISLVAHMRSPLVPAVHMNLRMIVTNRLWFGGGSDLTPLYPLEEDCKLFHSQLQECCDRHNPNYYAEFKSWCDRYFFLPHRNEPRGVGGIFFDYLNTQNWQSDFDFVRDVGETFLKTYPQIVRRHMHEGWSAAQREELLIKRGRYVEFNLIHDRGTQFGLKTGGNIEAILMSLPPEVKWL
ncbi:MAG: oxygen-dependent coproporphyrinogen oxidase [Alphaproteobacteria bacterium]|nr:oxygen-dependent coproporphyrinogen oxidase [Alphaproteobacteria bacterium]